MIQLLHYMVVFQKSKYMVEKSGIGEKKLYMNEVFVFCDAVDLINNLQYPIPLINGSIKEIP